MDKTSKIKIEIPILDLLQIIINSGIPITVNYVIIKYFYGSGDDLNIKLAHGAVIGFLITVLLTILLQNLLPKFRIFRPYKDYEGRWLQIIPEMEERPYSIMDIQYNKKLRRYELHGINFYKNIDSPQAIYFDSYKIVERTFHDGFYYITNTTSENINGLGKVGFVQNNYDKLSRAEGYFFDSSNDYNSLKYNTIIIKCNNNFYDYIYKKFNSEDICNFLPLENLNTDELPPLAIMKLSKDFAIEEIRKYKEIHSHRHWVKI